MNQQDDEKNGDNNNNGKDIYRTCNITKLLCSPYSVRKKGKLSPIYTIVLLLE